MKAGRPVALVSDAGTPGVSDPGSWLVREAIAAGVQVFPIPGANAAISALIASGLPADEFEFLGFLPEKAGARRTKLEDLAAHPGESARTLIFYEAPHRLLDTLADLESVFGPELRVAVARELTKIHEEFLRGTVAEVRSELGSRDRIRGEITLLIEVPAQTASSAGASGAANAHETISAPSAPHAVRRRRRRKRSAQAPGPRAGQVKERGLPRTPARARPQALIPTGARTLRNTGSIKCSILEISSSHD